MPANYNYDMIISQSPPSIFSPPAGFLTDYMSTYRRPFEPPGFSRPHIQNSHYLPHNPNYHQQSPASNVQRMHIKSLHLKMASAPKSCLARHEHSYNNSSTTTTSSDVDEPDNAAARPVTKTAQITATPKRVVFADDKGLALTQVKVMSEPSNVPPYWTLQFLSEVTHGLISPVAAEQWEVGFKQPASDYLAFRRILEERNVSLENVIVRESESIVVGTVKVRNLHFNKEVIVRVTYDKWKSQEDIQCTFSNLGGASVTGGAYALFDTFSFKLTLPPASKRSVEFCVCFRCNGEEYWDSNNGQNYTLSKRVNGTTVENSILSNAMSPASKLNQLTIIQDNSCNSWSSGMVPECQRPYW